MGIKRVTEFHRIYDEVTGHWWNHNSNRPGNGTWKENEAEGTLWDNLSNATNYKLGLLDAGQEEFWSKRDPVMWTERVLRMERAVVISYDLVRRQ